MALCAGLSAHDLAALHRVGRFHRLASGQVLHRAGDTATSCANLVSGILKVARQEADGQVQVVGLLYPGDFVGSPFADGASDTIAALSTVDLCVYSRPALLATLVERPAASRLLMRRTMATLAEARRWTRMLARSRAEARVAALLIDLARRCGQGQDVFRLPLSHSAMADALSLTAETVGRHMAAFHDDRLIELSGLRDLRVIDAVRLTGIAG